MKKTTVISLAVLNSFLVACGNPQQPPQQQSQGTTPQQKQCFVDDPNCERDRTNNSSTSHGSTFVPVILGARPYSGTVTGSSSSSGISSTSRGGFSASASSHAGGGAT